tara:strand:- start:189 stop:857 length:669 start_codon:yes stop_codon:yes gene_type:complete
MMQIYFDGCSNTRCQGYMGNDTTKPSKEQRDYLYLRWSKKICDELGAEEYNFADSGASNHRILRNLAQVQYKGLKYFDLIVIQMTFPHRFEWYDNDRNNWRRISIEKYNTLGYRGTNILRKKENDTFTEFWRSYYESGMYSEDYGRVHEEICFNSIKSICKANNLPLILLSCNNKTELDFDYIIKKSHPDEIEQENMIRDLLELYEQKMYQMIPNCSRQNRL